MVEPDVGGNVDLRAARRRHGQPLAGARSASQQHFGCGCRSCPSTISSTRSGWATRHSSTGTTRWDRYRRNPARPFVTAACTVVRKPVAGNVTVGRSRACPASPASSSAVVISSRLYVACASSPMCCHWHAPQPFATSGHGGVDAIRGRFEDLQHPRVHDPLAPGHRLHAHPLTRDGARDREDEPVGIAGDPVAVETELRRRQLERFGAIGRGS